MDYKKKYLKYKNKYLMLKNQIGKGSTFMEVDSTPTILVPGGDYVITGLISCVGVIIKKINPSNFTFNDGIAVHFVDGVHFNNGIITPQGNIVLNSISAYINSWNVDDTIDLDIVYSPHMDGKIMKASKEIIVLITKWFQSLKTWSNVTISKKPTPLNKEQTGYLHKYTFRA